MKGKVIILGAMLALLLVATAGWAQGNLEKHPGYVDFKTLEIAGDQEPTAEVNIKGSLLRLLTSSKTTDDPQLTSVLQRLVAIRVETYELDSLSTEGYVKTADRISKLLEARGWETIVSARERGERAKIAVRTEGDKIVGLFVMAIERDEAAFVNIVGEINPDEIGKLGKDLDIAPLDSVDLPTKRAPKKDRSH